MNRLRPIMVSLLVAGVALTLAVGPVDISPSPVRAQVGYGGDLPFTARSLVINGTQEPGLNLLLILVIMLAVLVGAVLVYRLVRRGRG